MHGVAETIGVVGQVVAERRSGERGIRRGRERGREREKERERVSGSGQSGSCSGFLTTPSSQPSSQTARKPRITTATVHKLLRTTSDAHTWVHRLGTFLAVGEPMVSMQGLTAFRTPLGRLQQHSRLFSPSLP